MKYVIAYDISDDSRRNRVACVLKDFGSRVQYSVFECSLDRDTLENILAELKPLMDMSTDRIHVYAICENCSARELSFGKALDATEGMDLWIV